MDTVVGSDEERLFSPDFVFATLANFFNSFGQQMLTATLPVYVLTIGGTAADVGLVSGALAFTALLLRPLVGWITDVWKRRPLILMGISCYGLASAIYLAASSVPMLIFGRIVHGYGLSNYTTAANAYLADIAPPSRRGEAMGLYSSAMSLGLIVGPALGFFLVSALGFQRLFFITAGLAATAFVISLFARERPRKMPAKRPAWSIRTSLVAVEALPIAWVAFCLGMGFGPLNAFISIFAQSRGVENPGLYFTVQAVALLISRTFAGQIADRKGRRAVMVPGITVAALSLVVLPFANGFPMFMLSAALFGLGFGAAQPATMALLVDRVKSEQRGLAMSTYFIGFDGGISIGSIGLGFVGQTWGFGVMWPIAAACALLGLLALVGARSQSAGARRPNAA